MAAKCSNCMARSRYSTIIFMRAVLALVRQGCDPKRGLLAGAFLRLLPLLSGGRARWIEYPFLRFTGVAAPDDLAGHTDPGGERRGLAAVTAGG
jgi:hypothetical protein